MSIASRIEDFVVIILLGACCCHINAHEMGGCTRPSFVSARSTALAAGGAHTVNVNNPNKDTTYTAHPIRLLVDVSGCRAADVSVINITSGGTGGSATTVPAQVEVFEGSPSKIGKAEVWILESIAPGQVHTYSVSCSPQQRGGGVNTKGPSAERKGATYVLSNSATKLVVAAAVPGASTVPAPFVGMSVNGVIVGGSTWDTTLEPSSFVSTIAANGPVFARVELRYRFAGGGSFNISFTLTGSDHHATVDEAFHAGTRATNDAWMLDLSARLQAKKAVLLNTHACDLSDPYSQPVLVHPVTKLVTASLQPNQRLGKALGYFFYRWNQGCDAKAAVGSADHLGAGLKP